MRATSFRAGARQRRVTARGQGLWLLALPCLAAAQAETATPVRTLPPVVVTATRIEAQSFDLPASVDRVDGAAIRDGRLQVNISESLGAVPGLQARNRQNYAQDVQISVRGFGARSTFGIRGVRLYVDDIPATLPDGQGQLSHVDLGSAQRIEVLRGPFSALYGNSSGGVIQVFTEEGEGRPKLSTSLAAGSDGIARGGLTLSGSSGAFGYLIDASAFKTDGYRAHSAAERRLANLKLTWKPDDASKLSWVVNSVSLPKAQDALGLSRAQFDADPRGVDASAIAFDTRKAVDQTQTGLVYERRLDGANTLRATAYSGRRDTAQFQSIPAATQANPLHPGGVISLARDYGGADLRWTTRTTILDRPFTLIAGAAYDTLREHRLGNLNFIGTTLGVAGALRRDEINKVWNFDQYLQATWQVSARWNLNLGVRRSRVHFVSTDRYIVASNPDDSGGVVYAATSPVVGLMFKATDALHLYATYGRGFETPTLNELAYRPNGATGLNFALQPSRSENAEVGVKTRLARWGELNVALFESRTRDELVTLTNVGGRSTYQNASATRRRGLEAAWSIEIVESLRTQLAYTWLDARYTRPFATCTAAPCAVANVQIPAGNRIPGIARQALYASAGWTPEFGLRGGVELRMLSRVYVNDTNSDAAAGYAIPSANIGYVVRHGAWELGSFARVDNLSGRRYAGSVIVNEGNARFFEPAPGATWTTGIQLATRF